LFANNTFETHTKLLANKGELFVFFCATNTEQQQLIRVQLPLLKHKATTHMKLLFLLVLAHTMAMSTAHAFDSTWQGTLITSSCSTPATKQSVAFAGEVISAKLDERQKHYVTSQ
jgi:hypothetical protein